MEFKFLFRRRNSALLFCVMITGIAGAAWVGYRAWIADNGSRLTGTAPRHLRSAPDFSLSDASGKKHGLSEFRGRWILLHFWASWCPPCITEIPEWVELQGLLKGEVQRAQGQADREVKLQFVAVSLDQRWEDAQKILPQARLPGEVISLLDPSLGVPEAYGTYQYPETYLINPELKIVTKWVGPQAWVSEPVREFFGRLINQ